MANNSELDDLIAAAAEAEELIPYQELERAMLIHCTECGGYYKPHEDCPNCL